MERSMKKKLFIILIILVAISIVIFVGIKIREKIDANTEFELSDNKYILDDGGLSTVDKGRTCKF